MPPPRLFALALEIKFAGSTNLRELETYVQTYASTLCANLALPVIPAVSLSSLEQNADSGLFYLVVDGFICRPTCWPALVLPETPSLQDYAELICLALFDRREFLLTLELVLRIATDWELRTEAGEWSPGWSADGFRYFLRAFPKSNFSLRHARRLIETHPAGVTSEFDAAYLFEQAIETAIAQSAGLQFGVAACIAEAEQSEHYQDMFKELTKSINDDLGFVCPAIRMIPGVLKPNEFQITINEIQLPVIRGMARGKVVVLANIAEIRKLELEHSQLFNPLDGYPFTCVDDSLQGNDLKLWKGGPAGYVRLSLRSIILRTAGSLLVSPTVHLLLQKLQNSPDADASLVNSAETHLGESPPLYRRLTVILRRLLDEQVPIADLAAILESFLSLREIYKDGRCSIYHFSDLEDSPVLAAEDKFIRDLGIDDFVFAARLGVRSLAVRDLENGRQILPVVPLPSDLQAALLSQGLSRDLNNQIVELLNAQPSQDLAMVVDQRLRSVIKELVRYEFAGVPVFGSREIPARVLAAGYDSLCNTFYATSRLRDSFLMAAQSVSLQPQSLIYLYYLKLTYRQLGHPTGDEAEYEIAARIDREPGWQIQAADFFFRQESFPEARLLYSDLATIYPENPLFRLRLGAYRRAIDLYRQSLTSSPADLDSQVNLGDALTNQGYYVSGLEQKQKYWNEAKEAFEQAVQLDPQCAWCHYRLGVLLAEFHRWDQACESFRHAIKLDKHIGTAYAELAHCLSRQGKVDQAMSALEEGQKANPAVPEIQLDIAKTYALADRFEEAATFVEGISQAEGPLKKEAAQLLTDLKSAQQTAVKLKAETQNPQIHAALGDLQAKIGNLPAAAARYKSATLADPAEPLYHKSLANLLIKLEEWQEAVSECKAALASEPNDAPVLNNLGFAHEALGETDEARGCYELAVRNAVGEPRYRYNLGNANYRRGHFEEARDSYRAAVNLNNEFVLAHSSLANCYYRLGQLDQAIDSWQAAIQLDPNLIDARFNLGVALLVATPPQPKEAAAHWSEALGRDRNLTFAEDNLTAIDQCNPPPHLAIFDLLNTRGAEESQAKSAPL
jgi:tetratricopeptide (TPR) repeat protein